MKVRRYLILLAFWVKERKYRGKPLVDPNDGNRVHPHLTLDTLNLYDVIKRNDEKRSKFIVKPEKIPEYGANWDMCGPTCSQVTVRMCQEIQGKVCITSSVQTSQLDGTLKMMLQMKIQNDCISCYTQGVGTRMMYRSFGLSWYLQFVITRPRGTP